MAQMTRRTATARTPAGRFSRTPATSARPRRRGKPQAQRGGLAGLVTKALPSSGATSAKGGGKAKPAFALLAAGAGALLGRKRLQKRKQQPEPFVASSPPAPAHAAADTPPVGTTPPPPTGM